MNIFLDTNVVLDFVLQREPHFEKANSAILVAIEGQHNLYISANCITDIFYITKRHGISTEIMREKLEHMLVFIDIVDITRSDIIKTLKVECTDFEDALQVRCAEKINAGYIITRDADFDGQSIKVISPQEFTESQ